MACRWPRNGSPHAGANPQPTPDEQHHHRRVHLLQQRPLALPELWLAWELAGAITRTCLACGVRWCLPQLPHTAGTAHHWLWRPEPWCICTRASLRPATLTPQSLIAAG